MLNIELLDDPAIPLVGIYPREIKTYVRANCTQMFMAALLIIVKRNMDGNVLSERNQT